MGSLPAGAAGEAPLPAETFFRHPALLDVKLSPSGRYLGLTSVQDNRRVGLLVVDLQTKEPAKVVAFFAKQDVVEFHWVNDERMLFKLGRIEPALIPTHLPGLFSVEVATGNYTELICSEIKSCFQQTGALKFDHGLMSVLRPQASVRPNEVIIGKYDPWMRHIEPKWLDVKGTLVRTMDMPKPPERAMQWWFDGQGRPRTMATPNSSATPRRTWPSSSRHRPWPRPRASRRRCCWPTARKTSACPRITAAACATR